MKNFPVKVFISYSHRDEALRDELISHLSPLKRQQLIDTWYDRAIAPGEDGDAVIDSNLMNADLILLLVSSDFISSMYCWDRELEKSLERHEATQAIVVPIIVRAVELKDASFGHIQSLPTDRKPVTSWGNRDEAWVDVIKGLRKTIEKLQERRNRSQDGHGFEGIGSILKVGSESIFADGIATGFFDLDQLISGFQPGELIVLGSRPSIGKTTFALNLAMNCSIARGIPVGFFSLETGREQIANRMLSITARADSRDLRSGRFGSDEWSRINSALNLLKITPLFVEDSRSLTTDSLLSSAMRLKDEHGLGLLIVDHLQLLDLSKTQVKQHQEKMQISKELKSIAREVNVPLLITTQLSRKIARRYDKRPYVEDLPEGYELEANADLVLLLFREECYEPYSPRRGILDVIVAKQRNGPTGEIHLIFMAPQGRVENLLVDSNGNFHGSDVPEPQP